MQGSAMPGRRSFAPGARAGIPRTFSALYAIAAALACFLAGIMAPAFRYMGYIRWRGEPPAMERFPELSIIVVVFNGARYLNRSLASLQRLRVERALVRMAFWDDVSEGDSVAMVDRFTGEDPRTSLVRNQRSKGTHATRVEAALHTETPFLTFLDPEDELVGVGAAVDAAVREHGHADALDDAADHGGVDCARLPASAGGRRPSPRPRPRAAARTRPSSPRTGPHQRPRARGS